MKLRSPPKKSFLCILIFSVPVFSNATSLYVRPFSEFTQTAPNIVHGILRNVHSENGTVEDGGKTIYTFANLVVQEVIKGKVQHQGEILIRKLGGTKDGVTLDIPSSVEFRENEETVLFLGEVKEDRSYEVVGMEMGKFGVKEEDGQKFLTDGIFALSHTDQDGDSHNSSNDLEENLKPWSLKQLRELIQKQTQGDPTPSPTPTLLHVKTSTSLTPSEKTPLLGQNATPSPRDPEPTPTNRSLHQKIVALLLIFAGLCGLFLYLKRR